VSTKFNISQRCALAAKQANHILDYISKSVANKVERGDPSPLLSTGEAISAVQCSVLGSSVQERRGLTGWSPLKRHEVDKQIGAFIIQRG